MVERLGIAFGVLVFLASSPAWADRTTAQYTSVTVFGDSLVDAGNYYLETGGAAIGPVDPKPENGYFEASPGSGHVRLTNGYVFTDLLSIDLFGVPTAPSRDGGSNYAYAAARIVTNANDTIPDMTAQIDSFVVNSVDPNGLYILSFGGNDVVALTGLFGDVITNPAAYLQAAAFGYAAGVQRLNDLGARNILLIDFPFGGEPANDFANAVLGVALGGLSLDPHTDLMVYKLSDFSQRVVAHPEDYGLPPLNTQIPCRATVVPPVSASPSCRGFYSFDGVHPTAEVQAAGYHDLLSQFNLTASVPEPSTWMMMLVGFGAIGAAMRRRHRAEARVSGAALPVARAVCRTASASG